MTRHRSAILVLAPAFMLTAAGCAGSNGPASPASYELATYGGAPLPVTVGRLVEASTQPGGPTVTCDDRLTASRIRLLPGGRYAQTDAHRLSCDDGRPDTANESTLAGSYTTGADTMVFDAALANDAHVISVGRRGDGTLTIYRREGAITGGPRTVDSTILVFEAVKQLATTSP